MTNKSRYSQQIMGPKFSDYVSAVTRRAFVSWRDDSAWISVSGYVAIVVSPILFAGVLAEIIGEGLERLLAWVALIWLLALIAVVTPYRVWREANVEISDLKSQLDTKEKRTAAMRRTQRRHETRVRLMEGRFRVDFRKWVRCDSGVTHPVCGCSS